MAAPRKTYTTTCAYGGEEITTRLPPSKRRGGVGCGRGECLDKHNAAAAGYAAEETARRSAAAKAGHARKGQPMAAWGDWGQLAAFSNKGVD